MNLLLVSGKLSNFVGVEGEPGHENMAHVTLTEQRWSNGARHEVKWYLEVPAFSEGFARKCIERDWKVSAFVSDIVSFTTPDWTDAGYMAWGRSLSIQL